MRIVLMLSPFLFVTQAAVAEPQCTLPSSLASEMTQPSVTASSKSSRPVVSDERTDHALVVAAGDSPALKHVAAVGATIAEVGTFHGLRTVVARNKDQFMRMHVTPGGRALVAGLMSDLSVARLREMAADHVTELGVYHGLRGLFVRNGGQFQVFYATPDEERVIPGVMFDAQGRNLTRDHVASIPGTVPTVALGDAATPTPQTGPAPLSEPAATLLQAAETTTYGTIGSASAPRLWVLVDPLCSWSVRAMEQLQPFVASGRVQLAVIPVAVLDREPGGRSSLAAKVMLSLPRDAMVAGWSRNRLDGTPEPEAERHLAVNMAAAKSIRLRGTPTLLWRKADGTEGRADGMPDDLDALIASIGR